MDHKGTEYSAIQILTRAVQLDGEMKFSEALICYDQGIRLLLQAKKDEANEIKKNHFTKKIEEYLDRAEVMKKASKKERESLRSHTQIRISDGEQGFSFDRIFSPLIDETLTRVEVEDAYIRSTHQIYNFLHLCELFVKKSIALRKIVLQTTHCTENAGLQKQRLEEIGISLSQHNIVFDSQFSDTLHDREIRLNNGWIVKIGRGLDYFKRSNGRFSLGYSDFDLRPCHETTIDIFHRSALKPS